MILRIGVGLGLRRSLAQLVWVMAVLVVSALAIGVASGPIQAAGFYGEPPDNGVCHQGQLDPRLDICIQCGNNGEVECTDPRFAQCSEKPSGFSPIGGICGRADRARGDFSLSNCGFPGFPQCPGPEGTVRCQVGTPDGGSGLCLACGDYGQNCCAPDRECDFGVCNQGICVKNPEPRIWGLWGSSIGFTYDMRQTGNSFDWNVVGPNTVREQGGGTIAWNAQIGRWQLNASWYGSNGGGSAVGDIVDSEPDGYARRVQWNNGVVFMRDPASPGVEIPGQATFEPGVDRMGMDYRDFDLAAEDPKLCQQACVNDPACKAWTFVKPPKQGPKPRCWLKNGIPQPTPDPLCVSGVARP